MNLLYQTQLLSACDHAQAHRQTGQKYMRMTSYSDNFALCSYKPNYISTYINFSHVTKL